MAWRVLILAFCAQVVFVACGATTYQSPSPNATPTSAPHPSGPQTPAATATTELIASPVATPTSPPSPSPSPSPRPTATPIDYRGWIPLSSGGLLANPFLAWSADGQHILVVRTSVNDPASSQFVDVFDRDGNLIQTFQGYDDAVWLDSERIALSVYKRASGQIVSQERVGIPEASSFVARLGSNDVEAVDANLAYARSNGHGALAIMTCWICRRGVGWYREVAYQIWTWEGGLTAKQRGAPYAWSRSGDRLLVEHPLESGPTRDSWWEIVTWPGLDRYARGGGVFDADFTRSARWYGDGEGVPGRIEVTKLLTGRQESFENPYESGNAAWDADGRLVLTDYESGEATAHALDGSVLDRWDRVGNYVSTSADHSTLVFWYWDQLDEPQVLSVLKDTELTSVTTPAPFFVGFDAVHVSPDGSAMVIVCYLAGQERALLFRL